MREPLVFSSKRYATSGEGGLITTNTHSVAKMCESLVWVGEAGRPLELTSQNGLEFPLDGVPRSVVAGTAETAERSKCKTPACERLLIERTTQPNPRHSTHFYSGLCARMCLSPLYLPLRCAGVWHSSAGVSFGARGGGHSVRLVTRFRFTVIRFFPVRTPQLPANIPSYVQMPRRPAKRQCGLNSACCLAAAMT